MESQATPTIVMLFGAGIAAVGAVLLTWAVHILRSRQRLEARGVRTVGTVVEHRVEIDAENSRLVYPIVEFVTAHGETLRVECLGSTQVAYGVGALVPVCYDPLQAEQAAIVGEGRFAGALFLVFAIGTLGLGVLMLIAGALGFPPVQ